MTTIAANREMIAGDSQMTYGVGGRGYRTQKIYRIDGKLYGMSGDMCAEVFLEWVATDFSKKAKPNFLPIWDDVDFDVLELSKEGLALWDKYLVKSKLKDDNYSIGSGSTIALVLMRKYEVSPDQAVIDCCDIDEYTKGPVDVLYLKDPDEIIIPKKIKEIKIK